MVIKLSREQKVFFFSLSPDPKEKGKKFAFLSIHLSFFTRWTEEKKCFNASPLDRRRLSLAIASSTF